MSQKMIVRKPISIVVSLVLLLGLSVPQLAEAQPARKLDGDEKVTELLKEGRKLVDAGNLPDAIVLYRQAAALDNKNPLIFSGIGFLQANQGKFREAIDAYQQAIALDPKNADFYYALGFSEANLGNNDAAVSAYRQATPL